jgi:hypothetical protein
VQAEHGRVDVDVADLDEVLEAAEDVEHLGPVESGGRGRVVVAARRGRGRLVDVEEVEVDGVGAGDGSGSSDVLLRRRPGCPRRPKLW